MAVKKLLSPQHRIVFGILSLCFAVLICPLSQASELVNLALHDEVYAFVKRLTVRGLIGKKLDNSQPLMRREIAEILMEVTEKRRAGQIQLTEAEKAHLERFQWLFADEIDALKPGFLPESEKSHAVTIKGAKYKLDFDFKLKEEASYARASSESDGTTSITSTNLILRAKLGSRLGVSSIINGRLLAGSGSYNPYQNEVSASYSGVLKGDSRMMHSMLAYTVLDFPWLSLQWGMDNLWWGPGWHGALMLSDNSIPTDTFKLSGLYGPLRFTFLTSILRTSGGDADKYYPKYMSAHRLEFIPYRGIGIGISEVVVFVERYEPRYLNPFLVFFTSQVEDRKTNGMLGFDLDITSLPSVELYTEIMIDDFQSGRGWDAFRAWNSKYGVLAGGYWADPFGLKDTDARIEYAFVNQYAYTNTWAGHSTDYTHQNFVIGHWMGTDADDLWFEIKRWIAGDFRASLTYELERQGEGDVKKRNPFEGSVDRPTQLIENWEFLSGTAESTHSFSAGLEYVSIGRWTAGADYTYSRIKNVGHKSGESGTEHRLTTKVERRF